MRVWPGIDNVLIEIDNEEVPILDGSAKEFRKILQYDFQVSTNQLRLLKLKK